MPENRAPLDPPNPSPRKGPGIEGKNLFGTLRHVARRDSPGEGPLSGERAPGEPEPALEQGIPRSGNAPEPAAEAPAADAPAADAPAALDDSGAASRGGTTSSAGASGNRPPRKRPGGQPASREPPPPQGPARATRRKAVSKAAPESDEAASAMRGSEQEGGEDGFAFTSKGYRRADGTVKVRKALYMAPEVVKAIEVIAKVDGVSEAEYVERLVTRDAERLRGIPPVDALLGEP